MLLKFKNVEGKWKLLPEFFGVPVEDMKSEKSQIDMLTYEVSDRAYAQYKADVKAGKFSTFKKANEALTDRMLQVTEDVEKALKEKSDRESAPKK
jgi:hypothetical protein